ncbi:MAG: septum site determining protein [Nocardioidaceae bacterium]|nr:septum site determining protein [Nocardioidaceae bacterium]
MTAPLLVTDDDALLDDLLRLAAAAGVVLDVASDVSAAQRAWSGAGLVLVGCDLAGPVAAASPPRRTGVQLLVRGRAPDELFRTALALGAENVAELPASESWLVETLTDAADGGASAGSLVAVVGGSGGAGASVFAGALALTLGRRGSALLVDADPWGAGADRLLGMEGVEGVRWDAIASTTGRLSARSLRQALPSRDGVAVLTWTATTLRRRAPVDRPLPLFAVREVLSAGTRGNDAVVVDLPRRPDPVVDEVLARADHVVLVCGVTVAAATAASRIAPRLAVLSAAKHLVVRGSGGVEPGEVARLLSVPLAAAMPDQRGVDESVDLGAGPLRSRRGALARAASLVADRVGPGLAQRMSA